MVRYLTLHVEGSASIIQKTPVPTESVAAAISKDNCHLWKCDNLLIRFPLVKDGCLVIISTAVLVPSLGAELRLLSRQEVSLHTQPQEEQEGEDMES